MCAPNGGPSGFEGPQFLGKMARLTPIREQQLMRIGVVGCGNIGSELCGAVLDGKVRGRIVALSDTDNDAAVQLKERLGGEPVIGSIRDVCEQVDFVVEAASGVAAPEVAQAAIDNGISALIMSCGGLLSHQDLFDQARAKGVEIIVPSGALVGLDGVRAVRDSGLEEVMLTTRKPPRGIAGAPYLEKKGIDVTMIRKPTVIFEGSASAAVEGFPKNVNVAAALSFACLGPERTKVRIVVDPAASVNVHEVVAKGDFGTIMTRSECLPSPRNAKTSYLAILSAISELKQAAEAFAKASAESSAR